MSEPPHHIAGTWVGTYTCTDCGGPSDGGVIMLAVALMVGCGNNDDEPLLKRCAFSTGSIGWALTVTLAFSQHCGEPEYTVTKRRER